MSPSKDELAGMKKVLVMAPHHDDEVLGVGGTIARLAENDAEVTVVVVTKGRSPRFPAELVERVRAEALTAHQKLGVAETLFLDLPAAALDQVAHADMNQAIGRVVGELMPDTLFLPFVGDMHLDHQLVFTSSMVASRPHKADYPARVFAYETLSETNWNAAPITPAFVPNVFIDISATLERKLEAMRCFDTQVYAPPHERSIEALQALATLRGATIHRQAAEAFVLIRAVM